MKLPSAGPKIWCSGLRFTNPARLGSLPRGAQTSNRFQSIQNQSKSLNTQERELNCISEIYLIKQFSSNGLTFKGCPNKDEQSARKINWKLIRSSDIFGKWSIRFQDKKSLDLYFQSQKPHSFLWKVFNLIHLPEICPSKIVNNFGLTKIHLLI